MAASGSAAPADDRPSHASIPSNEHATVQEPSAAFGDRFGTQLAADGPPILTQGAMDVAWKDGWIYVLSRGKLCVYRAGNELAPAGELSALGNTRQIEIAGNLAAITSREDGLWLVDIADPEKPTLLSHYDTIELATGIALADNLALVACRQYGLELIDVSQPRRPRHLSTFRTGEAQSVFLKDGLAYIGDWAPREVVVCDVHNPGRPVSVSHIPLDGFGDGVFVRQAVCFAATGHHGRQMQRRDPDDPAYGRGHGLEIFDVSDPKEPRLLSRTKLPQLYSRGYDMWSVQVSGDFAVVSDTHNGVYVFDIRDLAHPVPVGYHRLPRRAPDELPDAVGGLAIGRGCIYVAGARTGLHTVAVPGIEPIPRLPLEQIAVPASLPPVALPAFASVVYDPEGQVHEVAVDEQAGEAWIAAGTAGLHSLRPDEAGSGRQAASTSGVTFSVDLQGDLVATGEGLAGLSLWRRRSGEVELLGRYQSTAGGIGQVKISPDMRYVLVHAGSNTLEILDIRSPGRPKRVLDDQRPGLFYRTPFSHGFLPGGQFACIWHASGVFVFDLAGNMGPKYSGWNVPSESLTNTIANGAAVWNGRFVVTCGGGYAVLVPGQTEISKSLHQVRLSGVDLTGKPSVFGNTLYVAHRWKGKLAAVDIADPDHPRLRWSLQIEGNPGPVQQLHGKAIIPAGYDGVIVARGP
jgi:hypothetical protein